MVADIAKHVQYELAKLMISTIFFFYFRECRDDSLVKKVWGHGFGWNMFKNDLMSNCPQVTHTKTCGVLIHKQVHLSGIL